MVVSFGSAVVVADSVVFGDWSEQLVVVPAVVCCGSGVVTASVVDLLLLAVVVGSDDVVDSDAELVVVGVVVRRGMDAKRFGTGTAFVSHQLKYANIC